MKSHQKEFLAMHSSADDHEKMIDEVIKQHEEEGHSKDVPVWFNAAEHSNPHIKPEVQLKMAQRGGYEAAKKILKNARTLHQPTLDHIKENKHLEPDSIYRFLSYSSRKYDTPDLKAINDTFPVRSHYSHLFLMRQDRSENQDFISHLIKTSRDPSPIAEAAQKKYLNNKNIEDLLDKSLTHSHPDEFNAEFLRGREDLPASFVKKALIYPNNQVRSFVERTADFGNPEIQDHVLNHPMIDDDTKTAAVRSEKLPLHHLQALRTHFSRQPDSEYLTKRIDKQISERFPR